MNSDDYLAVLLLAGVSVALLAMASRIYARDRKQAQSEADQMLKDAGIEMFVLLDDVSGRITEPRSKRRIATDILHSRTNWGTLARPFRSADAEWKPVSFLITQDEFAELTGAARTKPKDKPSETVVKDPVRTERTHASGIGVAMIILGVLLIAYGWMMETSIPGNSEFARIHNLSLGQRQTLCVITGGISLIAGILLTTLSRQNQRA